MTGIAEAGDLVLKRLFYPMVTLLLQEKLGFEKLIHIIEYEVSQRLAILIGGERPFLTQIRTFPGAGYLTDIYYLG